MCCTFILTCILTYTEEAVNEFRLVTFLFCLFFIISSITGVWVNQILKSKYIGLPLTPRVNRIYEIKTILEEVTKNNYNGVYCFLVKAVKVIYDEHGDKEKSEEKIYEVYIANSFLVDKKPNLSIEYISFQNSHLLVLFKPKPKG